MALENISITFSTYESTDLDLGGGDSWYQIQLSAIVKVLRSIRIISL